MGSLTRGAVYTIIAQTVFVASTYLMQIGLGRLLGPELYGVYGVIMALITAVTMILTSGIEQAVSKKVSEKKELAGTIKDQALKIEIILSAIVFLAYMASAGAIAKLLNDASLTNYIRFSALVIPVYCIGKVYTGYFNGTKQFKKQSILMIAYSVLRLIFVFGLAYFFLINGIIAGIIAVSFVLLIASFLVSGKSEKGSFRMKELLFFAIPVTIFNIAFNLIFSVDIFLVKRILQDNAVVGYYNASVTLARSLYFLLSAISLVLLPSISEAITSSNQERAKKLIKEVMRYIFIGTIPLCLIISATPKNLVALFYQARYLPAATTLSTLIFGTAFLTLFFMLSTVLFGAGDTKKPMIIAIFVVIIDFILNIILIPMYGVSGAALATTISAMIGAAATGIIVIRKFGNFIALRSLTRIILASSFVYGLALIIPQTNKFLLPIEYSFLICAYAGILLLLGEITKEDITRIRGIMPGNVRSILPIKIE